MPQLINDFLSVIPNLREIIVTRHGQSRGQIDQGQYKVCGDNNIPLTPLGAQQALKAGQLLRRMGKDIVVIDHSLSLRATQTAEGIAEGLKPFSVRNLNPNALIDKQRFGKFDGLFSDEERQRLRPAEYRAFKEDLTQNGPVYARPPEGESLKDVIDRVGHYLVSYGDNQQPRLVVTHGTDELIIEALLLEHDETWLLHHLDTAKNVELIRFYRNANGRFEKEVLSDTPQPS